MATWINIPDSVLEVGKPARSIDAMALRDNAIAIARGAPGAPRILGRAAEKFEDLPVLTVVAADTYDISIGMSGSTVQKYTGSMRFSATLSFTGGGSGPINGEIRKNGVVVQSFSGTSDAPINAVVDVSVVPGDSVTWHSSGFSSWGNKRVRASDVYRTTQLYDAASEL